MRKVTDSKNRTVVDLEFDTNNDRSAFISAATYEDDGSKVDDTELEYLTDNYGDLCEEQAHERFAMRCEDAYDASREH